MEKLTDKNFWNSKYLSDTLDSEHSSKKNTLKKIIKKIFGKKVLEYAQNYPDYLLWEVIFKKHMPKQRGAEVVEVGSAPGDFLIKMNQEFGFEPYGIEYSDVGLKINRKKFRIHNINPDNVIFADFFLEKFQKQHNECFDIVISRGFIEHFVHTNRVIEKHINLLKKGGYLIVSIPNKGGFNYILSLIFNRKSLMMHNLNIMKKKEFYKQFDKECLSTLFCEYYGIFTFNQFDTPRNSPMLIVLKFCVLIQFILNIIFRCIFKDKGKESSLFSPYLLYIGIKK